MSKRATILRRIGGAVVLAAVVLSAAVPAVAGDERPRASRWVDDGPSVSAEGVEWTRLQSIEPTGVEWT
jgi:hypothetical protein